MPEITIQVDDTIDGAGIRDVGATDGGPVDDFAGSEKLDQPTTY